MMKRKANAQPEGQSAKSVLKKRVKTVLADDEIRKNFREGLFSPSVLQKYSEEYASSTPYKHSVISSLINDTLLRQVRGEIKENVHFTPKETDIYRIHQSGDLANLDGLDDGALEKLPSLLRLRDALYSAPFRKYVSAITGCGELSARKTDMAINVYTPGCHLLCHDDVIGSRRVSYILYLTDPDVEWMAEWGGALRLFPTQEFEEDGIKTITPSPDVVKIIPPAWNQLAFFAVQPGASFHDVEEVYRAETEEQLGKEGGRIRMAISGWYHIPQIGEEGYVEGEEEKWGKNSSLKQLQGDPDKCDFPKAQPVVVEVPTNMEKPEVTLVEADLDFLLTYMAPTYLTPETVEEIAERFMDLSSVTLDGILSTRFATEIEEYITAQEATLLPPSTDEIEQGAWKVARPPHKHRYLYLQPAVSSSQDSSPEYNPIKELLEVFLPSRQFRLWLEMAAQCDIENFDLVARRFRRGLDYELAKSHDGEPRLEVSIGLTPTPGWGAGDEDDEEEDEEDGNPDSKTDSRHKGIFSAKTREEPKDDETDNGDVVKDVGGHEVYMAADDEDDEDAAIYKASSDTEDDNTLFTAPASWNSMSIVLRDSGVLKFVKYVSKSAKGDRWDVSGAFGVKVLNRVEEEDEEVKGEIEDADAVALGESDEEEVFNGFPDSDDSDSE